LAVGQPGLVEGWWFGHPGGGDPVEVELDQLPLQGTPVVHGEHVGHGVGEVERPRVRLSPETGNHNSTGLHE
jgi:hypothetical protein